MTLHVMEKRLSGEIVFRTHYLSCMQENKYWYWKQEHIQQFIIVTTKTIVHPCLDFVGVKDVHDIPRSVCNINQEK